MGALERLRRSAGRLLGRGSAPEEAPARPPTDELLPDDLPATPEEALEGVDVDPQMDDDAPRLLDEEPGGEDDPVEPAFLDAETVEGETGEAPPSPSSGRRGLTGWVEARAHRVVSKVYDTRADDLEERARRIVSTAYTEKADDLEERAVRAMRRAISMEAERIKEAIEHGVQVKRREVRLSLLVLILAALIYLALYYFTKTPPA